MAEKQETYENQMSTLDKYLKDYENLEKQKRAGQNNAVLGDSLGMVSNAFSRPSVTASEIMAGVNPRQPAPYVNSADRVQGFQADKAQDLLNRYKIAQQKSSVLSDYQASKDRQATEGNKLAWEKEKLGIQNKNDLALEAAKAKTKDATDITKKPAGTQYTAGTFALRAEQAEDVFKDLESKNYNRANRWEEVSSKLPGEVQSEELRNQSQAERNFVNAILRKESGAAISPAEFVNAIQQYFPRPGDTPSTLKQKAENRAIATSGLKTEAGSAYDSIKQNYVGVDPNRFKGPTKPGQALGTPNPTASPIPKPLFKVEDVDNMTDEQVTQALKDLEGK